MAAVSAFITTLTHKRAALAKGKHVALGSTVVVDAAGGSPSSWCHPTETPVHLPQALLPASARDGQPLVATSSATTPGQNVNTCLLLWCTRM